MSARIESKVLKIWRKYLHHVQIPLLEGEFPANLKISPPLLLLHAWPPAT
jgi:hypothetical protein